LAHAANDIEVVGWIRILRYNPISARRAQALAAWGAAKKDQEGKLMLESIHLKNVGPAPEMKMDLAPRLNLITGDNCPATITPPP
jgi:hypothetical protein